MNTVSDIFYDQSVLLTTFIPNITNTTKHISTIKYLNFIS